MRVRLDRDFDAGAWPGVLAGRDSALGEAWLGPLGLLSHFETMLGLAGRSVTTQERAASLVPTLIHTSGFWSGSADADAPATATELLRWRDDLVLAGWRGQIEDVPQRIAELGAVTRDLAPGQGDRLRLVLDALSSRNTDPGVLCHLELTEPVEHHSVLWRRVFSALQAHGVRIDVVSLAAAETSGDLEAARRAGSGVVPVGDGTLQMLRSDGPWAAADEVAAWLAALPDLEGTVVIGPTALLDTELRRYGLPTTGGIDAHGGSGLLEVLPLVVDLGWRPTDPADALALLRLPESPVPHTVASRLLRALDEWPAVDSSAWSHALAEGLALIPEGRQRARVRERIAAIFTPAAPREGVARYATAELERRAELVRGWMRDRQSAQAAAGADARRLIVWSEALEHCALFERLIALAGRAHWTREEIHQILASTCAALARDGRRPAEAGLASVRSPGAIAGPARRIVWWSFDRSRTDRPVRLPFSRAERKQLASQGIVLRDPGEEALHLAQRWCRPLDQASSALVLVSSRRDEAGDESHPHPLWDEIRARASTPASADRLVVERLRHVPAASAVLCADRPLATLPRAHRTWRLTNSSLAVRAQESNASVESLLRCSFQWALRYGAPLRRRRRLEVDASPLVLGKLAHALFAEVLMTPIEHPEVMHERAERWFDTEGPRRVARLFFPGHEDRRAQVRRMLCDAVGAFAAFVRATGRHVRAAEQTLTGTGLGVALEGRPDLVIGEPTLVVDLKWSGLPYRRKDMQNGAASQLACYAHLLAQQQATHLPYPTVAFFILTERALLTTAADLPWPAQHVGGLSPQETWICLERAFVHRREELARGELDAPVHPDAQGNRAPERDGVDNLGRLTLAPTCRYCDYGGCCGHALAGAD